MTIHSPISRYLTTIGSGLLLVGSLLAFSACSHREDPLAEQQLSHTGTGRTARLSVEARVEQGALRVAGGPTVILSAGLPKVMLDATVTEVPVYCILRSSDGEVDIQRINWDRKPGSLQLTLKGEPVTFSPGFDFSIKPGRKWYMCGFIGDATVDAVNKKISFAQPKTGLQAIEEGAAQVNVPYVFPWIELDLVEDQGVMTFSPSAGVSFKPQGTLLSYTVENKLPKAYDLLGTGLVLKTRALDDDGAFDYGGAITPGQYPAWSFTNATVRDIYLKYSWLNTETVAHMAPLANRTYIFWAMPTGQTTEGTEAFLTGTTTSPVFDYTHAYHTSYAPQRNPATSSYNIPKTNRSYQIQATAVERLKIPLEFVAEGDIHVTSISTPIASTIALGGTISTEFGDQSVAGVTAPFSDWHLYVPTGYHIPNRSEAYILAPPTGLDAWATPAESHDVSESCTVGGRTVSGKSDFLNVTPSIGATTNTCYIYAIRFKGTPWASAWRYRIDNDALYYSWFPNYLISARWLGLGEELPSLSELQNKPESYWTAGVGRTLYPTSGYYTESKGLPGETTVPSFTMQAIYYLGLEGGQPFGIGTANTITTDASLYINAPGAQPAAFPIRPFFDSVD